ncbi:MAG: TRAP transporter large permease [Pseudomonadota bacterium]
MLGPGLMLLLILIALLGLGVWVGIALMAAGALSLALLREMNVIAFLAGDVWRSLNAPELAALPLFILMGEILNRTRLSQGLFAGLAPWLASIPGQLLHVNVAGCTLFAAVTGSSAATTATVGRITLAELARRGFDRDLAIGSLCGAGTLGFLIPPSIVLILYGVLAEVSIIDLFIAGITPGLLLAAGFMAFIAIRARLKPGLAPKPESTPSWRARLATLRQLGPVAALILLVIGSMALGYAGPSEAATVGVAGALILAAAQRALTIAGLVDALMGAVRTTSMLGLILAGAFFLAKAVALFGVPARAASFIAGLGLTPLALVILLMALYALLGMVMDGLSLILMTLPVTLPIALGAGFSPIWFGIFLVIVVEMSQITPPVGFNLFIVQELTGEPLGRIARASLPFFLLMAGLVVLIALLPDLVLWPLR